MFDSWRFCFFIMHKFYSNFDSSHWCREKCIDCHWGPDSHFINELKEFWLVLGVLLTKSLLRIIFVVYGYDIWLVYQSKLFVFLTQIATKFAQLNLCRGQRSFTLTLLQIVLLLFIPDRLFSNTEYLWGHPEHLRNLLNLFRIETHFYSKDALFPLI